MYYEPYEKKRGRKRRRRRRGCLGRLIGLLLKLLGLLRDKDMLSQVQAIDLSDTASVVMRYMGRFDVTFRWDADFDYKLDYLLAVVERLEANEKGAIDMTQDGKASFIPQ